MPSKSDDGSVVSVCRFRTVSGGFRDWLGAISNAVDDGTIIVMAPADAIHGAEHLQSALEHARRSISSGRSRARDPSIEVLRFLTGQRQVSRALEITTVDEPGSTILAVLVPERILKIDGSNIVIDMIEWKGGDPPHLESDTTGKWSGVDVRSRLGLSEDIPDDEIRYAVLEMVAMTDL